MNRRAIRAVLSGTRASVLIAVALLISACATPAYQKIDRQAQKLGFSRHMQDSDQFRHVLYAPENRRAKSNSIRVYIEGDGIAWQWRYFVKADPTPSRALMLNLMAKDKGNTLYVGRPCYFGLVHDDQCNADYWTFSRFSEKVVSSMSQVIAERTAGFGKVTLLGHSGGGALAMLIAERLPNVAAVVTVAGNIDTDAWVAHHKYTPLFGSLNPVKRVPLPERIKQLHLVGGNDRVIPPQLVTDWIRRQSSAQLWEIPQNDHLCCWDKQWSKVMAWIKQVEGNAFVANGW